MGVEEGRVSLPVDSQLCPCMTTSQEEHMGSCVCFFIVGLNFAFIVGRKKLPLL